MSTRRARPFLLVAGLVVTVAGIVIAVRGVALEDAADALAGARLWWLAPSLAVFVVGVWLRGLRWWALFRGARRPPLGEVTRALLVGYFFNSILPLRAGEAARVIGASARQARNAGLTRRRPGAQPQGRRCGVEDSRAPR